jgi:hypothetical protein
MLKNSGKKIKSSVISHRAVENGAFYFAEN